MTDIKKLTEQEKDKKIEELTSVVSLLMEYKTNFMTKVCAIRGVNTPCSSCGGLGIQIYNDASSWRHLQGFPPKVTKDVCEVCWGSGDSKYRWPSMHMEEAPFIDSDKCTVTTTATSTIESKEVFEEEPDEASYVDAVVN